MQVRGRASYATPAGPAPCKASVASLTTPAAAGAGEAGSELGPGACQEARAPQHGSEDGAGTGTCESRDSKASNICYIEEALRCTQNTMTTESLPPNEQQRQNLQPTLEHDNGDKVV